MKKYTREELAKSAIPFFEKNIGVNTLLACEDGQLFLDTAKSKGALASHCKELDLKIFTIERSEALALVVKPAGKKDKTDESGAGDKGTQNVVDYSRMNKQQLTEAAKAKGLEVPEELTKALIIELLNKPVESASGEVVTTKQE